MAACWRQTGYVMLLYLAGLKAVDPTLREAATVDGASETQTFFRVVFPVMRPINIIVLVITFIESLRAFDIVWVVNKGRNGLELISALVTAEHRRRGQPDRLRLGAGHDHAADLARSSSRIYLRDRDAEEDNAMSTAVATESPATTPAGPVAGRGADREAARILLHGFLIVIAAALAVPDRLRAAEQLPHLRLHRRRTATCRSAASPFNNYTNAWERADFTQHFINTIYITVPAVLLTLFLSSCMAFVLARFSFKFNLTLLGVFLAANLLPPAGAAHPAVPDVPRDPAADRS